MAEPVELTLLLEHPAGARCFRLGACIVVVERDRELGRWHLSVSRPGSTPSADDVAAAQSVFLPDIFMERVRLAGGVVHLIEAQPAR